MVAVHRAGEHTFSKHRTERIRLRARLGVEGDAHLGATVQHRSRVARDPTQPNLRQVHLIHGELHDALNARGFDVCPGDTAVIAVTGLRNPCVQLDRFRSGLMAAVLDRDATGGLQRLAGVMAV